MQIAPLGRFSWAWLPQAHGRFLPYLRAPALRCKTTKVSQTDSSIKYDQYEWFLADEWWTGGVIAPVF